MNQQKHTEDLHIGRGWLNRAAEMLDSCEDHLSDAEFARAAAAIGNGFIALAHAERAAGTSATLEAAAERVRRAAAEARPHDDEPVHPLDKDCSRGAFLRLECDLQLDGSSVLSLHKVGSDVHLRVWHAGSEQYAVAVLGRKYRRDVAHALTEFDTSEADRG